MPSNPQRTGAAYVIEPAELDTILAALRAWQVMGAGPTAEIVNIATNEGAHHQLGDADIDALCEYLNCGPAEPEPKKPVELSECCHATIGFDGWLDSNGDAISDPMDNCECMNCGMEGPEVWDGTSPPSPRSEREGGADLPEGVEEPPAKITCIVLHKQKRAKHPLWLADTTMDNGTEEQAPTPQLAGMDASVVATVLMRQHPHAMIGVRADDIGAAGGGIVWFDRAKLIPEVQK